MRHSPIFKYEKWSRCPRIEQRASAHTNTLREKPVCLLTYIGDAEACRWPRCSSRDLAAVPPCHKSPLSCDLLFGRLQLLRALGLRIRPHGIEQLRSHLLAKRLLCSLFRCLLQLPFSMRRFVFFEVHRFNLRVLDILATTLGIARAEQGATRRRHLPGLPFIFDRCRRHPRSWRLPLRRVRPRLRRHLRCLRLLLPRRLRCHVMRSLSVLFCGRLLRPLLHPAGLIHPGEYLV